MTNAKTPRVILKLRAIVRDKDGRPKFDDPEKIRLHLNDLTTDDIEYLRGKYDNIYFNG
jgi:hypothetical protein